MQESSSRPSSGRLSKVFDVKDYITNGEEKRYWLSSTVMSQDGYEKIMRYDLKKLVRFSALPTLFSKGTIFSMGHTSTLNVLMMVLLGLFASGVTVLVTWGDSEQLEAVDTQPLKDLSAQINALVPFVLAMYLGLGLTRWWKLRESGLGKVFDALTNVCMLISCELHEEKWEVVRKQVAKYGLASVTLITQAARRRPNLEHLIEAGLLNEDESASLEKSKELWERPMICWAWILRISMSAMDYAHTPPARSGRVMSECIMAKEGMAVMNMYLDTQLPFGYVHLITLLVNIQNMSMAVTSGIIFAQAIAAGHFFLMVQQALALVVVIYLYQGLLQISYVIANPFGDDVLNFPITGFVNYIATIVDAMFEAQVDCPVVAQDGSLWRPRKGNKAKAVDEGEEEETEGERTPAAQHPDGPSAAEDEGRHASRLL